MPLAAGTRLGPYQVLAPLGAGGMGEVYRARDPRLGRDVALKVLPAEVGADAQRLRRFEIEARAAGALSHPNLLAVFDTGCDGDAPYVIFELLEGETLRRRLERGSLPARKALDCAVLIARGLAAAHEKEIVHRDLKPENVFLTSDGGVKVLDFGLAKLRSGPPAGSVSDGATLSAVTEAGTVLGTVDYMSPEQLLGQAVDVRADIFSFGAVLYEILWGRPAFRRGSSVETMNAILKEDLPELPVEGPVVPLALERIVRRCLEKAPAERFRSAHDLAFALEALSGSFVEPRPKRPRPRPWLVPVVLTLGLVALPALGFLGGRAGRERVVPAFHRLTVRRGSVWSARFTPDGGTVFYGASWEGQPLKVFSTRVESPESLPLPVPDADVLAVSPKGELAIALDRPYLTLPPESFATLATVPFAGGETRERVRDVQSADWSPDGSKLAVVRRAGGRSRLEFPVGNTLYETTNGLMSVRVSPDGRRLAVIEARAPSEAPRRVVMLDLDGNRKVLAEGFFGIRLAWSPRGDEVWSMTEPDENAIVTAVDLQGRQRSVASLPAWVDVQDISSDGRVLMVVGQLRKGILAFRPGETQERDVSWFEVSSIADLSADGRMVLFSDRGPVTWTTYVRRADGSAGAVRLGEGRAEALSPDGRWVIARRDSGGHVVLPVGAGEPRSLDTGGLTCQDALWLPDGQRILLACREGDGMVREYLLDIEGGRPRPVTPEGIRCRAVSPEGRRVACTDPKGQGWIYPLEGGEPHPIAGLKSGDVPLQWSADGLSLFVRGSQQFPVRILRVDVGSGRRDVWRDLTPADPAGVFALEPRITRDGASHGYTYWRILSDLYVVDGLDPGKGAWR